MATNGTVTTTTRTTVGTQELRSNLHAIAAEIERVRTALDTTSLDQLVKSLKSLEVRISTVEQTTLGAAEEVDESRRELDRERERFQQLWQAYKTQEDELSGLKRQLGMAEGQTKTVDQLREEVQRLKLAGERAADADRALRENNVLKVEVENLNRDLRGAHAKLDANAAELVALRETATRVARLETVNKDLQLERERLAKLYKVYEERASDIQTLEGKLAAWEAWFSKMEPHMSQLCRMTGDAPRA